jgi:hypothetical protein
MRTPSGSIGCRWSRSSPTLAGVSAIAFIMMSGVALDGCAGTGGTSVDRLGADRFALKCLGPLAQCLVQVDDLCQGTRYTVESASDTRDYLGPRGITEHEVRTSEATIRCGTRGIALFGADAAHAARVDEAHAAGTTAAASGAASGPQTSPPASATDAKRACVPGATQTCVGPGACRGGQSCLSDGSGFSLCDCGGARTGGQSPGDAPASSPSSSPVPPSLSTPSAPSSSPPP